MPGGVDDFAFILSVFTPEKEDQVFFFVGERLDDGISELLPALILMATGLFGSNGESGI